MNRINGHDENAAKAQTLADKLIEDVGGPFGFKIRWTYTEEGAAFTVFSIVARQPDGLKLPLYLKANAKSDEDLTPDWLLADPYLSGAIKPDGRVWLTGSSVFRGATLLKRHLSLQKHLWEKAHKLMGATPKEAW